jgi:hypothetical protein
MRSAQRTLSFAALPLAAGLLAAAPAYGRRILAAERHGHWPRNTSRAAMRQSWGQPALQAGAWTTRTGAAGRRHLGLDHQRPLRRKRAAWNGTCTVATAGTPAARLQPAGLVQVPGRTSSAPRHQLRLWRTAAASATKSLYAKYNYTSRATFSASPTRAAPATSTSAPTTSWATRLTLNLHAGDGRVAGAGNGIWNWRDCQGPASPEARRRLERFRRLHPRLGRHRRLRPLHDRRAARRRRLAYSNVARRAVVLSLTRTF